MGFAIVAMMAMTTCGVYGWSMSRGLVQFKRLEGTTPGTPVDTLISEAGALGFERRPAGDLGPDDAGISRLELVKPNWPPLRPWHLRVHHVDGGVTSVTTLVPN
jgi:hypothetical protein